MMQKKRTIGELLEVARRRSRTKKLKEHDIMDMISSDIQLDKYVEYDI